MKLVTFNNLIPSYSMKLIQWHDVEGLDVEEAEAEPEVYSDEDADEEEVVGDRDFPVPNQVLQD